MRHTDYLFLSFQKADNPVSTETRWIKLVERDSGIEAFKYGAHRLQRHMADQSTL